MAAASCCHGNCLLIFQQSFLSDKGDSATFLTTVKSIGHSCRKWAGRVTWAALPCPHVRTPLGSGVTSLTLTCISEERRLSYVSSLVLTGWSFLSNVVFLCRSALSRGGPSKVRHGGTELSLLSSVKTIQAGFTVCHIKGCHWSRTPLCLGIDLKQLRQLHFSAEKSFSSTAPFTCVCN